MDTMTRVKEVSGKKNTTRRGIAENNAASIPSGELTYPTFGKGKSSSKLTFQGIC